MASSQSRRPSAAAGIFTSNTTVWTWALIMLAALGLLIVLRHFFGSFKVDFSAGAAS